MSREMQNGSNGTSGDIGGFALERRDLRNLERLTLDPRWQCPKRLKSMLPEHLTKMALGENGESERHQIMAGRILVAIIGQNQADQHLLFRAAAGVIDDDVGNEIIWVEPEGLLE